MRILAVFLSLNLVVSAQQPPAAPQAAEPKPQAAPAQAAAPATSQPSIASGVITRMNAPIENTAVSWFGTKNYIKKVFTHNDTRVVVEGPARLRDYVVDGKLTLSLKSYLDLVLANNTDIAVQRLTLETPKNAIQRAFGVFDPTINSTFSAQRAKTPATNTLIGANVLNQLDQPFSVSFSELLPYGTTIGSNLNISKTSTNNQFNTYNPAFTSTWTMNFTQPLLRNRGPYINRLPITIARINKKAADLTFESTIQGLLVTSENAYWDLISQRESLKVQEQALNLADVSLKRSLREVELGATSPLEIYQPQQNYATAEINLTQVKFQLQIAEEALRRQIGADLDPEIRKLPIVLTEDVKPSSDEAPLDREKLVQQALSRRPDLASSRTALEVNDLNIQSTLNLLRPNLSFGGRFSTTGRGGTTFERPLNAPVIAIPGGMTDTFGQFFNYNTFRFDLTLNFPIRDRATSANLADNVVNKKLAVLRMRSLEQSIRQDVLTAVNQVERSRASVRLAQVALDFAQKRADADQKRYDLGVINIFFLLSAQNDLTLAQSNLVNQTVSYRRNLRTLQQRLGAILEYRGIVLQ